jgi:hypothetical protein
MDRCRVYITGFEEFARLWIAFVFALSLVASWYSGKRFGKEEIRNDLIDQCSTGSPFLIDDREGVFSCYRVDSE